MTETVTGTGKTLTAASDAAAAEAGAIRAALHGLGLDDLLSAALLLLLCLAAARVLLRLLRKLLDRSRLSENLRFFLEKALRFTLYFITVLIVADALGLPVTSLLAVFSLLGLALSLSLQTLLGNLISGMVLLFTQPFAVGDYIEIHGMAGTVKQVDLFQTRLNSIDNKRVSIPNSDVLSSTITNYSAESARRVDVAFPASYDSPGESVEAAIRDCIASIDGILSDPAPEIVVTALRESNCEYTARVWAKPQDCVAVRDQLNSRILPYYRKHGVRLSYPRVTLER